MSSVEFSYGELAQDLRNFAATEQGFLSVAGPNLLTEAAENLLRASKSPNRTIWQIEDQPYSRIETRVSAGECELGDNVKWSLIGTLSLKWEIIRTSMGKNSRFKIINATTKMRILACSASEAGNNRVGSELAIWRFEIGDPKHPGIMFHSQVEWPLHDDRRLEIPRLPSIVLTPVECLDFMLGELFQARWPKEQRGLQWQSNQRLRLIKLLSEAKRVVTDSTASLNISR